MSGHSKTNHNNMHRKIHMVKHVQRHNFLENAIKKHNPTKFNHHKTHAKIMDSLFLIGFIALVICLFFLKKFGYN